MEASAEEWLENEEVVSCSHYPAAAVCSDSSAALCPHVVSQQTFPGNGEFTGNLREELQLGGEAPDSKSDSLWWYFGLCVVYYRFRQARPAHSIHKRNRIVKGFKTTVKEILNDLEIN